jgi:hypothetical protein
VFFTSLGTVLPCLSCSTNYQRHLRELPMEPALKKGGNALFEWTVQLHNLTNAESGKDPRTADEVILRLAKGDQRSMLSSGHALGVGAIAGVGLGVGAAYYYWVKRARAR